MLLGWFAVPIWGRIPVSKSGPEIHVLGDFFNRFLVPIWGPESGPEIGTAKQNLHKTVPISGPESGPKIGTANEPKKYSLRSENLAPRSDFGTGFLSPNRDPKVVQKVDQDVYFPTSSGCLEDVLFVGILTSPECSGCVLAYRHSREDNTCALRSSDGRSRGLAREILELGSSVLQFVDYWRPSVDLSEPCGIRRLKAAIGCVFQHLHFPASGLAFGQRRCLSAVPGGASRRL